MQLDTGARRKERTWILYGLKRQRRGKMETVKGGETGREGERVRTETQGEEREQKKGDETTQLRHTEVGRAICTVTGNK